MWANKNFSYKLVYVCFMIIVCYALLARLLDSNSNYKIEEKKINKTKYKTMPTIWHMSPYLSPN